MIVTGVNRRSCEGECALYNTMFETTAFFKQQGGAASCRPIQRAVVCGENEKMVRARVNGTMSPMRFCVAEDETRMDMPVNTL